ncbi:MAG: N-acylglucosamine 2-epimerase [Planctomycetota bacterium]|nr:MAG: N-acylglucosamine 2-epimerase [Planctomycetota bacterium]
MTISSAFYYDQLVNKILPFWENNSIDKEFNGYFTCLNEDGSVYDTDKFIWLQARQVWVFSKLYNDLNQNESWKDIATSGVKFLTEHGQDPDGNWYFSLNQSGKPLMAPYNIFSDCFAAMALSEYAKLNKDMELKEKSLKTFQNIQKRSSEPNNKYKKAITENRGFHSLSLPMISLNLQLEMNWILDSKDFLTKINAQAHQIIDRHLDKNLNIFLENIAINTIDQDTFQGRLISPGHGIETTWFLMDVGLLTNDTSLIDKSISILLSTLEYGWDSKYGGLFYFMDKHNKPMQELEHDQKLWWVHQEALIATAMGWRIQQNEDCQKWFKKLHDYAWDHFNDPKHGEWFGYLHRTGEKLNTSKGGKWKGCFHTPRAIYRCYKELKMIESQ